jgi:hypothetical protein
VTVTAEEIRWIVEAFPRLKAGGYPVTPGVVKGSATSIAAAAFMDGARRLTNCQLAYGFLWHSPNHEGCRWELDAYLEERGHTHGGIRRARDLVLRCWAYETGETMARGA